MADPASKRSERRRRRRRPVLTNDQLLYDPDMDERDQQWVDKQRRKYQPAAAPGPRWETRDDPRRTGEDGVGAGIAQYLTAPVGRAGWSHTTVHHSAGVRMVWVLGSLFCAALVGRDRIRIYCRASQRWWGCCEWGGILAAFVVACRARWHQLPIWIIRLVDIFPCIFRL